jgi:hypothetical protein
MDFFNKYLKYKNKYLNIKKQIGGMEDDVRTPIFPVKIDIGRPVNEITIFFQNIGVNELHQKKQEGASAAATSAADAAAAKGRWYQQNHKKALFSTLFSKYLNIDFAVFQEVWAEDVLNINVSPQIKSVVAMCAHQDRYRKAGLEYDHQRKPKGEKHPYYFDTKYKLLLTIQNTNSTLSLDEGKTFSYLSNALLDKDSFKLRNDKLLIMMGNPAIDSVEGKNLKDINEYIEYMKPYMTPPRMILRRNLMKPANDVDLFKHMMFSFYGDWLIINTHLDGSALGEYLSKLLDNLSNYIIPYNKYKIIICGDFNYEPIIYDQIYSKFLSKNRMSMHIDYKMGFIISSNLTYELERYIDSLANRIKLKTEHSGYICKFRAVENNKMQPKIYTLIAHEFKDPKENTVDTKRTINTTKKKAVLFSLWKTVFEEAKIYYMTKESASLDPIQERLERDSKEELEKVLQVERKLEAAKKQKVGEEHKAKQKLEAAKQQEAEQKRLAQQEEQKLLAQQEQEAKEKQIAERKYAAKQKREAEQQEAEQQKREAEQEAEKKRLEEAVTDVLDTWDNSSPDNEEAAAKLLNT